MTNLKDGQYYGSILRSRDISGIILTEKIHSAGEKLPEHCHSNAYFCNVLRGHWNEKFQNRERECKPYKSIYHPPGESHSDSFNQTGHTFNIEFTPGRFKDFLSISSTLSFSNEFYYDEINLISIKIFNEFKIIDKFSSLAIEGLAAELIAHTARRFSNSKDDSRQVWLKKVKDIINDRYMDKISLREISYQVGIHPVHISRTFRISTGCTLSEYQRKIRIENSCFELRDKNISIADIALKYGFCDQSHFSKFFKNLIGLTPLQYRKQIAEC